MYGIVDVDMWWVDGAWIGPPQVSSSSPIPIPLLSMHHPTYHIFMYHLYVSIQIVDISYICNDTD